MGLLTEGNPLSWEETKKLNQHVRKHGIIQFINLYQRLKDRQGDELKWGDEVEYILVKFFDNEKVARVSLRAAELLQILNKKEQEDPEGVKSLWRPEYGAYMIEGTPGQPYGGLLAHLNVVEANMRYRRQEVSELLEPGEVVMSLTNFPRIGTPEFTWPIFEPAPENKDGVTRSDYFPDEAICRCHPRFKTIAKNIRHRRGSRIDINCPIFKDKNTNIPVAGSLPNKPDAVHMDATGFGMGCCCLQVTFQACNLTEARTLYDQLAPLCPIMMALTAASPVHRGYLTENDCRWNIISASVDCRTPEERGEKPLKDGQFRIYKSRYDSIDSYLSPEGEKYNDVPLVYDENVYQDLRNGEVDHLMAQHVAHLFIRDALSLYNEQVHQNDEEDTEHFENIQSTNWQTMRFKPPPPNSTIGWRVEFRPCEAQLTDFENAAFVCFIVLLTRVILSYGLNFLIPISKVDENMQTAQKRNALKTKKFWFRKHVNEKTSETIDCNGNSDEIKNRNYFSGITCEKEYQLMSINQIFNGDDTFSGLIPMIISYLDSMEVDTDTHCTIQQYLRFIQRRASGELITMASWIRKEVLNHPEYNNDSIVTERINYDILKKAKEIQEGVQHCAELLGHGINTRTKDSIPTLLEDILKCNNGC